MILQPLDVIVEKGHGPVSLFIRLLTSIRYGIPFKFCKSHVCLGYNAIMTISAEPKGTILVPFEDCPKNKDLVVYRFNELPDLDGFYELANKLLNRPYAYARYALDAARIFSFVFAVTGLILSLFTWKLKIGIFVAIGILQILIVWLRKKDIQSSDCAEVSSIILLSKLLTLPDPRNEFPNNVELKMQILCQYGLATKVYEWNCKTKKWENK